MQRRRWKVESEGGEILIEIFLFSCFHSIFRVYLRYNKQEMYFVPTQH